MSVCLLLREPRDLELLPMAAALAAVDDSPLTLLELSRRGGVRETDLSEPLSGEPSDDAIETGIRDWLAAMARPQVAPSDDSHTKAIDDATDSSNAQDSDAAVGYFRIVTQDPERALGDQVSRLGARLLILPQAQSVGRKPSESLEWQLLRSVPCETLLMRWQTGAPPALGHVLVATMGGANAAAAFTRATAVTGAGGGRVTALYVVPGVDEVAPLVGQRILKRISQRALGVMPDHVRLRVEVADTFRQGLHQARDDRPDLIMIGASERREITRMLADPGPQTDSADENPPAVAIVRAAMPLASRAGRLVNRVLQAYVPQLSREQRVTLVERVQSSSQWDFDFTVLMCLSTLIAGLGLLLNSAAIIIGAMLVAPLMTPLVGSGLAIVQGNSLLFRRAMYSVLQGFTMALLVALLLGALIRLIAGTDDLPNTEMLARGSPSILDLIVAFVSGLVAAYAMGRPGLTSALPGVAIAAALVPPIATAGMSAAWGDFALTAGALLLFLTNIVAIALATAISLRVVGIRDSHPHGTTQRWSRVAATVLCLAALGLAVYESRPHPRVPADLRQALAILIEYDGGRLESARWQDDARGEPVIGVQARHVTAETGDLVNRLAAVARQHYEHSDHEPVDLQLEIRIVQRTAPLDATSP